MIHIEMYNNILSAFKNVTHFAIQAVVYFNCEVRSADLLNLGWVVWSLGEILGLQKRSIFSICIYKTLSFVLYIV